MNMELKELMRQQAEIKKRIDEILNRDYIVEGRVKLEKRGNPDGTDAYCVSVRASGRQAERANCWLSVITAAERNDCLEDALELVEDIRRMVSRAINGVDCLMAEVPDEDV